MKAARSSRSAGGGYGRLLALAPSVRSALIGSIAAGILSAVLLIAQAFFLSRIVADVLFHHRSLRDVAPLCVLAASVLAARAACTVVREVVTKRAAIRVKAELRERLAAHLLALGPAYANGERTGDLVAAAGEGMDKLDAYVGRYLPHTVLGVVAPLVIVLGIAPVDLLSVGLLLFTVPVIAVLMILIGTFTRDHVQAQWETLGRLSTAFLDVLQGLPTLLLLDRDDRERRRVAAISEDFRNHTLSVLKVAFLSSAVLELMTAAGIGLIATVLGIRLLNGDIPFDRAFFVFLLTPEFYRPLRELGTHRHAMIEGSAAAEHIDGILQTPAPLAVHGAAGPLMERVPLPAHACPTIDLDLVTYVYPDREAPALERVTLSLPARTSTALIGRSGAGKSTLVDLLMRSIEPSSGTIRIDGVPLHTVSADAWRERVALVPQRPYLFAGTVRDNIRLARPDATDDEVHRAAMLAGCLPFIEALRGGFDTMLGERGEGLSAGERQRLAIARAFLKDAPVLILDEPTSALDPSSEAGIREALQILTRGRTVLVVAHRLSTVRAAERIAVLDRGRLVETGTHEELRLRGGLYASLMGGQQAVEVAV